MKMNIYDRNEYLLFLSKEYFSEGNNYVTNLKNIKNLKIEYSSILFI